MSTSSSVSSAGAVLTTAGSPGDFTAFHAWLDQAENPAAAGDALGRLPRVEAMARALERLPGGESTICAVFGSGGSGKSWMLERVSHLLEAAEARALAVCRFSPWEMDTAEGLRTEFFRAVRQALSLAGAGPEVIAYWSTLAEICAAGDGREGSLREAKAALAQRLHGGLERPLLVVMDDFDLLPAPELQAFLRLLATTARLPGLHYLIAGDWRRMARALDPVCGGEGAAYLEKLIPHSFQMAEPGPEAIRAALGRGLEMLAAACGVDFATQAPRLDDLWDAFLKLRITSLRAGHRWLRAAAWRAAALMDEGALAVDLADLLGVEFLQVFDPGTHARLAEGSAAGGWLSPQGRALLGPKLGELLEKSELPRPVLLGALTGLFPQFREPLAGHLNAIPQAGRSPFRRAAPSGRGVCQEDYRALYFQASIDPAVLPHRVAREFLLRLTDDESAAAALTEARSQGRLAQVLRVLRGSGEAPSPEASRRLLRARCEISDDLEDPAPGEGELAEAARLLPHLLSGLGEGEDGESCKRVLREVIGGSPQVTLPLYLLRELRQGAPGGTPPWSVEEIEELCDEIAPRVAERYHTGDFLRHSGDAFRAWAWRQALGTERTAPVIAEVLRRTTAEGEDDDDPAARALAAQHAAERLWTLTDAVITGAAQMAVRPRLTAAELMPQLDLFAPRDLWLTFLLKNDPPPSWPGPSAAFAQYLRASVSPFSLAG